MHINLEEHSCGGCLVAQQSGGLLKSQVRVIRIFQEFSSGVVLGCLSTTTVRVFQKISCGILWIL